MVGGEWTCLEMCGWPLEDEEGTLSLSDPEVDVLDMGVMQASG